MSPAIEHAEEFENAEVIMVASSDKGPALAAVKPAARAKTIALYAAAGVAASAAATVTALVAANRVAVWRRPRRSPFVARFLSGRWVQRARTMFPQTGKGSRRRRA